MAVPRYEIRDNRTLLGRALRKQRFHVVLIGLNGEILSSTEKFRSLDGALTNIAAQRKDAPVAVTEFVYIDNPATPEGS